MTSVNLLRLRKKIYYLYILDQMLGLKIVQNVYYT